MILSVGVEPQGEETGVAMGDDDLTAEKLSVVPPHGDFVLTVLVEIVNNVDVVIQIDAAICHHGADAGYVRPVKQSPAVAKGLTEDFWWQLDRLDDDSSMEIPFGYDPLPVVAGEVALVDVRVQIDAIRLLLNVGGT